MAELKTKPTAVSADAFIKSIDDEGRRKDCKDLVAMMTKATKAKPAPGRPTVARPTSVAAPKASGPKVNPKAAAAFEALPEYVAQQGIDSTADPAAVLTDPIVPKF